MWDVMPARSSGRLARSLSAEAVFPIVKIISTAYQDAGGRVGVDRVESEAFETLFEAVCFAVPLCINICIAPDRWSFVKTVEISALAIASSFS